MDAAAAQPAAAQSAAVKAESAGEVDKTVLSKTGGVRKDEIYGSYVEKLATLKHEIAGLDKEAYKHVFSFFSRVDKTLDFLYDEVDVDRKSENAPDPSGLRNDQEYEFLKEIGDLKEGDKPKFQYYDSKAGKFVQLTNTNDYRGKFLWDRLGGGLLHTERAKFSLAESDDIGALRKYVVDNLRLFVMKAIDTYFASKEAGKLDQFFEHLKALGACIEDQCLHMVGFEAKHLTAGTTLSRQEIAELERIANQEPGADGPAVEDAETLFVDTFGDLDEEAWFDGMEKKSWTPDVSAFLKEKLVGKTCTMMTYNEASKHFEVMKNKQGAPVVRPLTAADIDTLCRKAFEKVYS